MTETQHDHLPLEEKKPIDSDAATPSSNTSHADVELGTVSIGPQLKRGLNARHITIISFGGVIGTGIFLSVGSALHTAGPAILTAAFVAYSVIMWAIAQAIGEMGTHLPIEGTFITWANRYINGHVGFTVGWNFYYTKTVICCAQISAVIGLVQFWAPQVNPAIIISVNLVVLFLLNIGGPGRYGEFEFWFSILKIILILGLLLMTLVLMCGGNPNHDAFGFRYWKNPGPANPYIATGSLGYFLAFWSMFKTAAFTIGGPDFIAITSAETINPRRLVPKCINRVVYRICFLFILSVICCGILCPSNDPELLKQLKSGHGVAYSPWVVGMYRAGLSPVLPNIVNGVILTSAASCGNADMFMSTRALHALAINGHAPKIFAKTLKNGCPLPALLMTLIFCCFTYMTVSQGSSSAFTVFTSLAAIGVMLNYMWLLVSWVCFRKAMKAQNIPVSSLPFKGLATPWGPRIALFFVVIIIITNGFNVFCKGHWSIKGFLGAYFGLIWTAILYLGYYIIVRPKSGIPACQVDLVTGKAEVDADEAYWKINRPLPVTMWQKFQEWLF